MIDVASGWISALTERNLESDGLFLLRDLVSGNLYAYKLFSPSMSTQFWLAAAAA